MASESPALNLQCCCNNSVSVSTHVFFLVVIAGDKVNRGEHGDEDGEKRHRHRQTVGLAGGELSPLNSVGG